MAASSSSEKKKNSREREDNVKKLTDKFLQLRSNAFHQGLNLEQQREAFNNTNITTTSSEKSAAQWRLAQPLLPLLHLKSAQKLITFLKAYKLHVMVAAAAVTVTTLTMLVYSLSYEFFTENPCLVDPNIFSEEVYRPVVDCDMCRDVVDVPEERNLSVDDFYRKYAFTGRPVLVKEATKNWTAMTTFSYTYFRDLYKETKGSLSTIEEECQFFPYNTEFITLAEAFTMTEARASFQPGELPWYIGWSNCHPGVSEKLRQHYERPYFLPHDSEAVREDWIFMGGPGPGALIHLDYVQRPSWQAQISGSKIWELVPTPECEAVCHSFNVTVQKGDIIVVDTNIWYHSTYVNPGEISITIGSEFD